MFKYHSSCFWYLNEEREDMFDDLLLKMHLAILGHHPFKVFLCVVEMEKLISGENPSYRQLPYKRRLEVFSKIQEGVHFVLEFMLQYLETGNGDFSRIKVICDLWSNRFKSYFQVTQEEIQGLCKSYHQQRILFLLCELKKGATFDPLIISYIKSSMSTYGISYEQLNISKEMLDELEREMKPEFVKRLVKEVVADDSNVSDDELALIKEHYDKGVLNLQELGVSNEHFFGLLYK